MLSGGKVGMPITALKKYGHLSHFLKLEDMIKPYLDGKELYVRYIYSISQETIDWFNKLMASGSIILYTP